PRHPETDHPGADDGDVRPLDHKKSRLPVMASPARMVVILIRTRFPSMPQVVPQKRFRQTCRPGAVTTSVGSRPDSDTCYREALTRSSGEGPGCGIKDQ